MNSVTGLVSPQFHVKFDPLFQTVKQGEVKSEWQTKAGFVIQKELSPRTMKTDRNKVSEGDQTLNSEGDKNPTESSGYNNMPELKASLQQVGSHEPTSCKRLKSSIMKQSDPTNENKRIRTDNGKSVERVTDKVNIKNVNLENVPKPQQMEAMMI